MNNKINLEKMTKKGKGYLIGGLTIVIFALLFTFLTYSGFKDEYNNPLNFLDVYEEDKYAKIDVNLMTDYFATYETEEKIEKVYLVFDDNNIGYLALLDEKTKKELEDILKYSYDEITNEPENVKIYGTTVKIPSDLESLTIDYYNELVEEEIINHSNFNEWLGYYYLDTSIDPINDNMPFVLVLSVILVIVGVCLLFIYYKRNKNIKDSLDKYKDYMDKIENELNSEENIKYTKQKLYFTNNFLITFINGLNILEYKDIVWYYEKSFKYRGTTTKTLYVVTKDKKVHTVTSLVMNKKNNVIYNEIYEMMKIKLPNALEGFTRENSNKINGEYNK